MRLPVIALLLGLNLATAGDRRIYLSARGWRARIRCWIDSFDGDAWSEDMAIARQVLRDARTYLEGNGWKLTAGSTRDGDWMLPHELRDPAPGRLGRYVGIEGALRRQRERDRRGANDAGEAGHARAS